MIAEQAGPAGRPQATTRRRIVPAALAGTIVVVVAVLLIFGGSGSSRHRPAAVTHAPPQAVTVAQLQTLPAVMGHPVYWVGPARRTYELTRFSDGNVLLRYLPLRTPVGTPAQTYLAIGSYPVKNAYAQVQQGARRPGAKSRPAPGGGLAVVPAGHPQSAYLAHPGSNLLVEVYTPSPARSLKIALSHKLRAIR